MVMMASARWSIASQTCRFSASLLSLERSFQAIVTGVCYRHPTPACVQAARASVAEQGLPAHTEEVYNAEPDGQSTLAVLRITRAGHSTKGKKERT